MARLFWVAVLLTACVAVYADIESQIILRKLHVGSRVHHLQLQLQNSAVESVLKHAALSKLNEVSNGCSKLHYDYEDYEMQAANLHADLDKLSVDFSLSATPSCTFCSNDTSNSTIWRRFPISRNFVCNTDCQFIRELLDDGRNQMVDNFLDYFNTLQYININGTAKDIFFTNVLMALLKQTKTNPLKYVSHGTDHAVRVMNWNAQLYGVQEVADALEEKFNTTKNESIFALMLNGLLHDCGYTPLDYILYYPAPPKWIHSVLGKWTNEVLLYEKTTNALGARILGLMTTKPENATVEDFLEGIRYHNFDDQFCLWTAPNNTLFNKMCSFDTSKMPIPPLVGEGIYHRTYTPATAALSPFIFTIRIADNLDFINTRLTSTQRNPKLMLWLWYLYKDQTVRNAVIANSASLANVTGQAKDRYRECVWGKDWKDDADFKSGELMNVMDGCTTESFLHFYSNWMVNGTSFNATSYTLYVTLTSTDIEQLKFQYNPGPALYQINRMASSMNSLFVNHNTSFLDSVTVVLNQAVPGMDSTSFPLKAFTQKPVFAPTGPTGASICGQFCINLTRYLTNSPESCIEYYDGKYVETTDETVCNYTAFSKLPTFSDLNYIPNLVPNSQPSSGKLTCLGSDNNSSKKKTDKILIIVLPIVFGVTLIVVGVLVYLARKRKSYRPIS